MAPTQNNCLRRGKFLKKEGKFRNKWSPIVVLQRLEDDKKLRKTLVTSLESAHEVSVTSPESNIELQEFPERHQCFVCAQIFDLKEVWSLHLEKIHSIQIKILKLDGSSVVCDAEQVPHADEELVQDDQGCQDRQELDDQNDSSGDNDKTKEERNPDAIGHVKGQTYKLNIDITENLVSSTTHPVLVKEETKKSSKVVSGGLFSTSEKNVQIKEKSDCLVSTTPNPIQVEENVDKYGNATKNDYSKKKRIYCEICGQLHCGLSRLRMHQIETHTVCPMLECNLCSILFDNLTIFNKHQNIQHGVPFPCQFCDKKLADEKSKKEHMYKKHATLGFCDECKKFKTALKEHISRVHSDKVECKVCKALVPEANLTAHMVNCRSQSERILLCNKCGKRFVHRRRLIAHEKKVHEPAVCGSTQKSQAFLIKHKKPLHQPNGERNWISKKKSIGCFIINGILIFLIIAFATLYFIKSKDCDPGNKRGISIFWKSEVKIPKFKFSCEKRWNF